MNTMIQKYSAIHTLVLIVVCIAMRLTGIGDGAAFTNDDFETALGKVLFAIAVLYIVAPVGINTLFMLWHMLKNGKWLWFVATMLFAFGATVPYYFAVYRSEQFI